MRGTPAAIEKTVADSGIIPANAGNTVRDGRRILDCRDHPR